MKIVILILYVQLGQNGVNGLAVPWILVLKATNSLEEHTLENVSVDQRMKVEISGLSMKVQTVNAIQLIALRIRVVYETKQPIKDLYHVLS